LLRPFEQDDSICVIIIDSRVTFLRAGDSPSMPAWHTDFVKRVMGETHQPDYSTLNHNVKAIIATVSDRGQEENPGVSNTIFLQGSVRLNLKSEETYYHLHRDLEALRANVKYDVFAPTLAVAQGDSSFRLRHSQDGDLILMDQQTLHSATRAHSTGTRYFVRISIVDSLQNQVFQKKVPNEIRTTVMVYRSVGDESTHTVDPNELRVLEEGAVREELLSPLLRFHSGHKHGRAEREDLTIREWDTSWKTVAELKQEATFVGADLDFARQHAGPITSDFLEVVARDAWANQADLRISVHTFMLFQEHYTDNPAPKTGPPFSEPELWGTPVASWREADEARSCPFYYMSVNSKDLRFGEMRYFGPDQSREMAARHQTELQKHAEMNNAQNAEPLRFANEPHQADQVGPAWPDGSRGRLVFDETSTGTIYRFEANAVHMMTGVQGHGWSVRLVAALCGPARNKLTIQEVVYVFPGRSW
jgi:hypothetical protein